MKSEYREMIEFKKAIKEDIPTIQQIAYNTWHPTFGKMMPESQIEYMLELMYSENSIKNQMQEKNHIFLLALVDNQSVGFASYENNYKAESQLMIHKGISVAILSRTRCWKKIIQSSF